MGDVRDARPPGCRNCEALRAWVRSGEYVFEVTPSSHDVDFRPRSPLPPSPECALRFCGLRRVVAVFLQVLSVGLCYLHDPFGDEAR